jgi:protein-tyrosine phosphatase
MEGLKMTTDAPPQLRDHRFLDLAGAHNLRHVAGWRRADGATLKTGLLLRSSGLEELTPADLDSLASLGITEVFDLRSEHERTSNASRWHADAAPRTWSGAHCAAAANLAMLINGPELSLDELKGELLAVYRSFPQDLAGALRAVLDAMEAGSGPVLVHCAAGKDRTGFVIAMILRALGVREEDVVADYLMTNETFALARARFERRDFIAGLEARTPGAIRVLLGALEEYLATADATIVAGWGTHEAYLREMVGLDQARMTSLRARAFDAP